MYFKYILSVLLFISCSEATVQPISVCKFENDVRLYCPVTINGHTFSFIIDTGADMSAIDYFKAKEAGILPTDSCMKSISFYHCDWKGIIYNIKTEIKIGDTFMPCNLTFLNQKDAPALDLREGDGVIGMDVMSQLNWFVDLKKDSLWLSTQKMDYPVKSEPSFTIEMLENRTAYVHITLCDSIERRFLFDTGYSLTNPVQDYNLSTVLVLPDDLLNKYLNDTARMCHISFEARTWLIYDDLKIQNLSLPYALLDNNLVNNGNPVDYLGILTCEFLAYFDYMAYDKEKRKIFLYNYNSDIVRTKDMKEIYHRIRRAYKEQKNYNTIFKRQQP